MAEERLPAEFAHTTPREGLGQSEAYLAFQESLRQVAGVDRPVLILGERGTGKELAAARLHYLSRRWEGPLVTLNCAALSETLIESELFGYEAGAFTGARKARQGRFEAANGGTIFLDELGNIPLQVQEKILRVVEYGVFERVGSTETVSVDVRIIGATHADLQALCEEGRFMRDLLDRLSFEVLHLPPLRKREEDIMLLARHFAVRMAHELGHDDVPDFSAGAEAALCSYHWPGNVRELKNVVERAVYRNAGESINSICFDPFAPLEGEERREATTPHTPVDEESMSGRERIPPPEQKVSLPPPLYEEEPTEREVCDLLAVGLKERVRELEVSMVSEALERGRYNQREAARILGLTYHQFRGLYRKYEDVLAG